MNGLYILTNTILKNNNTIKIGMSMRLHERLFDYEKVFTNNYYEYCYKLKDITKNEILYLEKIILNKTEIYRDNNFSTEYRKISCDYTINNYHNLIINILNDFKILYEILIKPIFERPITLLQTEDIDRTNELLNIKHNPFQHTKREKIQIAYLEDIIIQLNLYKKVLYIAPTGLGKTAIFYNLIKQQQYLRVIIFTPRRILNKQTIEEKYTYILNNNYNYVIFNNSSTQCKLNIKQLIKDHVKLIIISCYQSAKVLLSHIKKHNIDIVIFDEAHFIQSWDNKIENDKLEYIKYYLESTKIKNRLFLTATASESMLANNNIFGNSINKVKVYIKAFIYILFYSIILQKCC